MLWLGGGWVGRSRGDELIYGWSPIGVGIIGWFMILMYLAWDRMGWESGRLI